VVGDRGGYIPSWPTAPSPQFTSHETACILNAPEEEAQVEITIYSSHREPVSLLATYLEEGLQEVCVMHHWVQVTRRQAPLRGWGPMNRTA